MINIVCVLAWPPIAKYLKPNGLNKTLFSHRTGDWKSKIKALRDLVLGEGSLPGLQMAAILLCPYVGISCLHLYGEREFCVFFL